MIADTVRSHPRPGSNSDGAMISYHENLSGSVVAADHARALRRGASNSYQFVAAPLSHGSNPNSNMAGRRREDDENLVPVEAQTFDWQMGGSWSEGGRSRSWIHDAPGRTRSPSTTKTLALYQGEAHGVRRLTPTECERLQALPDGWTDFGPDSRRYAALGDAVTASVSEWIGRRLVEAT